MESLVISIFFLILSIIKWVIILYVAAIGLFFVFVGLVWLLGEILKTITEILDGTFFRELKEAFNRKIF